MKNPNLPGMSLEPGAPSTKAFISAATVCMSVPSSPLNVIRPSSSPLLTIVFEPIVALRDLPR